MSDSQDYIIDIDGLRPLSPPTEPGASAARPSLKGRPWLAVRWQCCHTYSRVYRDPSGLSYSGRCPLCGKRVRAAVGPGGVSSRFFDAY